LFETTRIHIIMEYEKRLDREGKQPVTKPKTKPIYRLVEDTVIACMRNNVPRLGASLAYYTLFAIAPLFVMALAVAAFAFGQEAARHELFGQLSALVGEQGGKALEAVIAAADKPKAGVLAASVAIAMLFIGATGVFVELQEALNIIWNVTRSAQHGFKRFVTDRMLSFSLVLGIGFLLLVSLVVSAMLAALGRLLNGMIPGEILILGAINFLISLGVITILFAIIFKALPDVSIAWRDVSIGAFLTAVLFNIGKFLFGFYLGRSGVASAYGAAGALVIVLLWVYYSTQILLFGAQFTRIYANRYGSRAKPVPGAQPGSISQTPQSIR
jgi:membrane protein